MLHNEAHERLCKKYVGERKEKIATDAGAFKEGKQNAVKVGAPP